MGHAAECAARFLKGRRFLICDGDSKFRYRFKIVMEAAGIKLIKTPFQAPNANAYAERFVRSIKDECLNRMTKVLLAEVREVLIDRMYHGERNHQGLGNELIDGGVAGVDGEVVRHERLGGLLNFYERAA